MPCDPLQNRFWTRILELFGLNDTQSIYLLARAIIGSKNLRTISVVDVRVLDCHTVTSVRIPTISILSCVDTFTCARDIDIIKYNIASISNKMVVLRRVSQVQITQDGVFKSVNADQNGTKSVDITGVQIIPGLTVAVNGSATIQVNVVSGEEPERCSTITRCFNTMIQKRP